MSQLTTHLSNGQGGIRTHDTVTRIQHFQCCSFNRSDTCPTKAFYELRLTTSRQGTWR